MPVVSGTETLTDTGSQKIGLNKDSGCCKRGKRKRSGDREYGVTPVRLRSGTCGFNVAAAVCES